MLKPRVMSALLSGWKSPWLSHVRIPDGPKVRLPSSLVVKLEAVIRRNIRTRAVTMLIEWMWCQTTPRVNAVELRKDVAILRGADMGY